MLAPAILDNVLANRITSEAMHLRLREWRGRRGLSMRGLAARAGGSYVTIARIEAGAMSPTVALLERLAQALEIHITDLFPPKQPKGARVIKRSSVPRDLRRETRGRVDGRLAAIADTGEGG